MNIRAITVCNPHAWAIIHGDKPYENRGWPSGYRGRLLIHAGKSREWLEDFPQYDGEPPAKDLVFGAIIGVVDMIDCVTPDQAFRKRGFRHETAEGPWCHEYANPRPLIRPVPWKGSLGLWLPTEELMRLVEAAGLEETRP